MCFCVKYHTNTVSVLVHSISLIRTEQYTVKCPYDFLEMSWMAWNELKMNELLACISKVHLHFSTFSTYTIVEFVWRATTLLQGINMQITFNNNVKAFSPSLGVRFWFIFYIDMRSNFLLVWWLFQSVILHLLMPQNCHWCFFLRLSDAILK